MAKQILLEDVIKTINSTDLRKVMLYHESYPGTISSGPETGFQGGYNMDKFYSELYFAQLTIKYDVRDEKKIVDRPIRLSLAITNPANNIREEFYRLHKDLVDKDVKAKIDRNPYIESINMVYSPDENSLETLRKDMNIIYGVINRYYGIKEKYLR